MLFKKGLALVPCPAASVVEQSLAKQLSEHCMLTKMVFEFTEAEDVSSLVNDPGVNL